MKISTRLSLTYSIISSVVFIVFGGTVYFLSSNHRRIDFQDRLKERVIITEKIFLEKDSFSPEELKKITEQFLHTLPQETEEVVMLEKGDLPKFNYKYPKDFISALPKENEYDFEHLNIQGSSRIFNVGGKDYLIVVTASDVEGLQNISFLKFLIVILILIGIPVIFIVSFVITNRALLPISKKIDKANTIGASNLYQRLSVINPNDEIGKLAIAFNKLLDRLEASFETQKSFIRNASHEIRNPLTAIIGEAEVSLNKARTNSEYLTSLKTILSEADMLNLTVNNLLQLSKVSANEENIDYELIHFAKFVNEVKESFDFVNIENRINIKITPESESEHYNILGNRNLLKTAVFNILDNACKYSNNQKVEVLLSSENKQVVLTVKDQGIGILDVDMPKITTPFYRGNNAMKIKGSGIGLSICSKILNLHKGSLDIRSEINKGTVVSCTLPLAKV